MRAAALALLLVAGCNQIFGLDEGSGGDDDGDGGGDGGPGDGPMRDDAARCTSTSTADEDGDGAPNDCDVCPHRSDAEQLDEDHDGVGNACDPDPGGENSIVFFEPFDNPQLTGWVQLGGSWMQGNGFATQGNAEHLSPILLRDVALPPSVFIDAAFVVNAFATAAPDGLRSAGVIFHAGQELNGGVAPDGIECVFSTDTQSSVYAVNLVKWSAGIPSVIAGQPVNTPLEENGRYDLAEGTTTLLTACNAGFDSADRIGEANGAAVLTSGSAIALHSRYASTSWAYVIVISRP